MSETSIKSVRQQLLQGKAKEFLNFAGKVFAYTFDEITELYLADTSVNAVATGEQWEKLGFRLKSDVKGIELSSNKTVYDVAQTTAPHRFGRFEYLPEAKAHIIERYRSYSRNSARLTSTSVEEAIYDFVNWQVTQSSYSSEYIKNHKELIADCAIYTVFARLDLLTSEMNFDFSNISSAVSSEKDTVEFLSAYRECIYNTLILTRKAVWQAQAELEKKNEAIEQAMSDREAFADTADELYNYRTGNSWHIVKVQNVYTNNKGVQIYTLGGINGDKFKVTLSKAQFEKLALPVIVDDNQEDVIEQIEDKPGATVVEVVETVSEANAVIDYKNKTYELFKPVDDFSAAEIEKLTKDYINTVFYEEKISASVVDLAIVGSRSRGLENDNSDIDVAVEVSSDELKEDALFNILHEEEFTIGDTIVDINPIRAEESGTLADYLERAEIYLSEKKEASTSKVEDKGPITLNRTSDGWKLRGINARNAAEVLGLELSKEYNDDVCSFDESNKDNYFQQLRDAGYSILIAETFELGTSKKDNVKAENTEEEDIISYAEEMAKAVIPDNEDELAEEDEPEEQTSRKGRGRKVSKSKSNSDYTPIREYVIDAEKPVFQITPDMFDYVLCCGNPKGDLTGKSYNYPQSIYAIITQFATETNAEKNADYLKNAFTGAARGYFFRTLDGSNVQRITARFDDDLIKITAGTSSENPFAEAFYSYEDAANRISELLESGTYCEQHYIDDAQDTQLFYISERLWYLHQDTDKDVYDYFIPEEMFKGGAPDSMQRIYEALKDADTFNTYLEGMKKFVSDYANNRDILRWHIHKPDELLSIFENAVKEHKQFSARPDFTVARHFFVSDDEADLVLMNEAPYHKFDFVEYRKSLDTSGFAKKIKSAYGIGGGSTVNGLSKSHDARGLTISFGYTSNNEKLHLSYSEIARRISRMIDSGEFITEKDRAEFLRGLKFDLRQYFEDKIKWEQTEPSKRYSWDTPNEPFYNKTVNRLKALGADVETIIAEEQANAQETINDIPVPAIMRDTTNATGTLSDDTSSNNETVSQPEAVVVEAEEPKALTDSFDEVSRDKDENAELIEFANEFAAANAEIEKDMPQENEQLSFFSFGAAQAAEPVKTYAVLLSKSDDTVTPSIINHYDKDKTDNHIYEGKHYVYNVYGENKSNAQKDLIKLRSMLRDHTLDVDYYLSLIPSDEQQNYIDKVSARHLPLAYEKKGEVSPKCIFKGRDAEIVSSLTNHVAYTEYDESTQSNQLTVTLSDYELSSNADKLSAVGYYFADRNELGQQEKHIIETVKVGDFWEVYDEDAHIVSEALGLHLTKKNGRDMVGFPDHVRDIYHEQLKSAGYGIMMSSGKFDTAKASKKIIDVTAQNIYDHLVSSFPRIMDKTYTYMRYSKGENSGFMPLTLEWVGEDVLSIAHTYTQNGDLMDDPEIRLVIDNENGVANCISFSNSGMGIYREYEVGDARSKDCNKFMTTWLNNIDHTDYSLMRTIRINEEGVDIEQNYGNRPLDECRYDIFYVEQNGGYTAYNRLEKSSDEQYDVMAEISVDGAAVINNSDLIPSYYKTQIERYGKRKFVDPEVFNACAVIRYVKDFGNGSSDYRYDYDPQGIRELAHNSKYVDREIAKLIDDIALKSQTADFASRTYNLSDDELDFVVSRITSALAEYKKPETYISDIQTSERAILNESTKDVIFNSVFLELDTLDKLSQTEPEIDAISEPKKVYQVITDDNDSGIDDKLEYSSEQAAIAAGKRYLDEGYRGYAVWNTETKRILDYSAEFRLDKGFNMETLRDNGYYEEAARAQALIDSISVSEVPEKETANPYVIEVGDTVNALGSGDRELVVTAVNEDGTVEVRDDNTGWYPVFQTLPMHQISASIEQSAAKNELESSLTRFSDGENALQDYIITNDDLGVATPKVRADANIKAIELLNKLKDEHRYATPDEQNILASYSGWGALPDVFDKRKDNFLSERDKLQELLTDNEYRTANDSIFTAFYTQPAIIRSIYRALDNFGFEGGKILEPAMGTGNFFGMMPSEMRAKSELHGVEIDRVSGEIAKQLYPNAKVSICGYEDTKFSDNSFDVVVGNVPFGSFKVFDNRYNRHNLLIHDYYFIKTLDKVKPGGIVAFITSSGTLDKKNSKVRKMMCERAELLGAVRLPYTAFKGNAGTDVVSDIIFLKKRENITAVRENWIDTTYEPSARANVNNYFLEHPEMVCGKLTNHSTAYGYDMNVEPFEDISLEDALNERIDKIIGKYEPVVSTLKLSEEDKQEDQYINRIDDSIPDFCFGVIPSGEIVYRTGDLLKIENTTEKSKKQYKAAIRVSRAVRHIIDIQQEMPTESNKERLDREFEIAKAELNAAYDSYRASYGSINNSTNRRKKYDFSLDRNFSLMCSLEIKVEEPGKDAYYVKGSELFERRTIYKKPEIKHCDTINDAFLVSLNIRSRIDIAYISELTEKPVSEIINELDGVFMYRNPEKVKEDDITSGWEPVDQYLSGNIRTKLQKAKDAAVNDKSYEKNVEALEKVMPERLTSADITCQLGSSWIPEDVISQFMMEIFNLPSYMKTYCEIEHNIPTATWYIQHKSMSRGIEASTVYGSPDMNGLEVLENSLNRRSCVIYDRVRDEDGNMTSKKNPEKTREIGLKQDALQQAFIDWVYTDAERTSRLEDIYNKLYNSERVRKFDGSFLSFDGMNENIHLKEHQKNAVARVLFGGNSLLAHVVGAGKTFEMAAAVMELKRTGAANKSLIVVPNHLIGQWEKEFLTLYPGANIFAATSEDFKKKNRKIFTARMATGDYDAIIMGYSTFSKIGISDERRKMYYKQQIDECELMLMDAEKGSLSEKMLKKKLKNFENSLKSMEYVVKQDDEITFEELGVDRIFIDEAHNYKNLQVLTKLGNVKGLQNTRSKRAEDLLFKIRYINELQGDERGVVLATGTPISNSMTEMYVMQKYLQNDYLERKGLGHFDAWISDFGKIEKVIELNPTGQGFRMTKRCSSFNNLPELMVMFNRCTDIQTAEMLNLPIPKLKNGEYTISVCHPSEIQKEFIKHCGERADAVRSGSIDPSVDNMLCITNDGKMCALDMRLVDENADDLPESKINTAVRNIYNKWKDTEDKRLTQIVFLDRSTPTDDGSFNLYDDIRNKLVNMGVPKDEVRFIHEAKNDEQKLALFDDVNAGKVRVIIGSTEKMGAGTNIQTRLCALHHLDVPWRPSDIEQREGRILRQGNTNSEVEIFRYVTEGTFDAYSWQTIESKQKFISQVMTGNAAGRSAEDVDSAVLNYAQIKALATGDPRIKEHFDLEQEVNDLRTRKGQFNKAHYAMRDRLNKELPQIIATETKFVGIFKSAKEYAAENSKPFDDEHNPFKVTFCNREYDKREDAGQKIFEIINSGAAYQEAYNVGQYRGFELSLMFSASSQCHVMTLKHGDCSITKEVPESSIGIFMRLDNMINKSIDELLVAHSQKLSSAVKEKETCEQHANDKFPQAEELIEKEKRLRELAAALSLDKAADENADMLSETPDDGDPITSPGDGGRK